ncbi:MAG: xanthine dehydrogenase family protein molybdopterin-binding subunit [Firmicutes bacterium]|nr:xanthine dehydrogenase family protein molybdopterin-binding subunit [Bacillota bacterium]
MSLFEHNNNKYNIVGKDIKRVDALEKVTGTALYAADLYKGNMLYGGNVRIKEYPAKITKIDTKEAEAIPGVVKIITCFDKNAKKHSWADYCYLTDEVKFCGDVVAIVAAESKKAVDKAIKSIKVEYELQEGVYTIEDALKEDAPIVREKGVGLIDGIPNKEKKGNIFLDSYYPIRKGNVEEGFKKCDVIIEREFNVPFIDQAYIETEACLVYNDPKDGSITGEASAQNPFFTRRYLAEASGHNMSESRFIQRTLGGTFGGKEEGVGVQIGRAAILHKATGRPVKMVNTREESLMDSSKRHAFNFKYKIGATKDGDILAAEGTLVDNCGAYNNQTQFMNWRASVHSVGVYEIPNVKTDTYGVFTNNVHGGAMRGYSSPQVIFAQEQLMNELAKELGMDSVELRRKNIIRQNTRTATNQLITEEVILEEMMDELLKRTDYYSKKKEFEDFNKKDNNIKKGISLVTVYRGAGLGAEGVDANGAFIQATEDGSVIINTGLAENGQGLQTAYAQIAAEMLGVTMDKIHFHSVDTHAIADSGMTVASRGTTMGAQSMKLAAEKLALIFKEHVAEKFGTTVDRISCKDNYYFDIEDNFPANYSSDKRIAFKDVCNERLWAGQQLAVYEWFRPALNEYDHHIGQGKAFPTYTYNVCIAEVEVDVETGDIKVTKVTSGLDCGRVINPNMVKGQMLGGIVMGLGYAITEEIELKKGRILNDNFDSYILPTSMDMPEMDVVLFESETKEGTLGAKSVGEPATEAVAAAIAGSVGHALNKNVDHLPCSLESILKYMD